MAERVLYHSPGSRTGRVDVLLDALPRTRAYSERLKAGIAAG